jgi:hypothetical protein
VQEARLCLPGQPFPFRGIAPLPGCRTHASWTQRRSVAAGDSSGIDPLSDPLINPLIKPLIDSARP